MLTFQTKNFDLSAPKGWNFSKIEANNWLLENTTDNYGFTIKVGDEGIMEAEELEKYLTQIFTAIPLADGQILYAVDDSDISYNNGLAYEYRFEGSEIEEVQGFWRLYYYGVSIHPETKRLVSFFATIVIPPSSFFSLNDYVTEVFTIADTLRWKINPQKMEQKPNFQPVIHPFTQKLANTKLTFLESYNSGNQGGGYSIEEQFSLYENQQFTYYYAHTASAYSYGGMSLGGGYKEKKGAGVWSVSSDGENISFGFDNGEVLQYALTVSKGVVYLDDKKFFWERI